MLNTTRTSLRAACMAAALTACVTAVPATGRAQDRPDSAKADTARKKADLGPMRTIEFDTDEGTWMNLDLSPDGRTIVFDLLGDIYAVPAAGGDAILLAGGRSWDRQPRFSPDGKLIAFSSDRDGNANVWIMDADGKHPRQVTKDALGPVTQPAWAPDGDYLVVRKNVQTAYEYYGTELWLVHRNGGGGMKLTQTTRFNYPTDPAFSADGRFIYFSTTGRFPLINRYDRETKDFITAPTLGGVAAQASPDGRWLAYVRRHDARSELRLHEMRTHAERVLLPSITLDASEDFINAQGGFPSMAFTRDSRRLLYTNGGKIHLLDVADGRDVVVPLRVHVRLEVPNPIQVANTIPDADLVAKGIRWPTMSPDGKRLAFSALGKLYVMDLPGGKPRRLTTSAEREYAPAFSPDGRSIAYTTWSDSGAGNLRVISADGAASRTLTPSAGHYLNPAWSNDGTKLLFLATTNPELRGRQPEQSPYFDLLWMRSSGPDSVHLITSVRPPRQQLRAHTVASFNADGTRIFFTEQENAAQPGDGEKNVLVSTRLDGTDKQQYFRFSGVDQAIPSPDGKHVAVVRMENVWVLALPQYSTGVVDFNFQSPAVPARQLSMEGGEYVNWRGTNEVVWAFTNHVLRQSLDSASKPETTLVTVSVPRAKPSGTTAYVNARLVTMRGSEVVQRGTIVVKDNRIVAAGAGVEVPRGAKVIDVAGRTIVPGLVDVHAHLFYNAYELFPQQKWQMLANLAYGVTTMFDPSAHSVDVFPQAEMVETGDLLGPRIYSTGDVIYGTTIFPSMYAPINTIDDARHIVRRYKEWGAIMLKQYLQPTRIRRQLLAQAAREMGVRITAEGGSDMYLDLSMVADGYTAFEHSLPIVPLYKDVVQFLALSGTHYTPTLLVSYGGPTLETWWYASDNHHDDAKLRRFVPEDVLDGHRRREVLPADEYQWLRVSQSAAAVAHAGGKVTLGAHGQLQGLGGLWELWGLQMGGLTNHEALREGTLVGAEKLGLEHDLGSLEAGKVADFLILDANPLDDLHNMEKLRYVVKNGFLFDGASLTQLWPEHRQLNAFFWQSRDEAKQFAAPLAKAP